MSFQIDLDPFERAYAHLVRQVREALQLTFEEEAENGLTQREIAATLGVDEALVSRRMNGPGNITLRTLSDLYTAMGHEPLANFTPPNAIVAKSVYYTLASTSSIAVKYELAAKSVGGTPIPNPMIPMLLPA